MISDAVEDLGRVEGVRMALVASLDGLLVCSGGRAGEDEEMVAAMSAAILGTVNRAVTSAGLGGALEVLVGAATSSLQIMAVDDLAIVVVASKDTNVGLVRLAMKRTASRLREFLVKEKTWSKH
ncbi:MAG: roadblock/LC7 domain-containing protein [Chloroflexota bacterium]